MSRTLTTLPSWLNRGVPVLVALAACLATLTACTWLERQAYVAATQPASWQATTTQAVEASIATGGILASPLTDGLAATLAGAALIIWRLLVRWAAAKAAIREVNANPASPPIIQQVTSEAAKWITTLVTKNTTP
jgi:hypothetical protein